MLTPSQLQQVFGVQQSKLSLADDPNCAATSRQRNRSLKKTAAVSDDDPSTAAECPLTRRAASFDASQQLKSPPIGPVMMRPLSFDAARGSQRVSAFSPIDVPRLLVQSPNSPLNVERALTPDQRLLTVPSPDFARKSPIGCESPKGDYLTSMALAPTLLGQLTAIASMQQAMAAHAMEVDPPKPSLLNPLHAMSSHESGSSFDMSSSLDIAGPSGIDTHGHAPSATAEILASMPSKAVIQDDIRSGQGRFQLVRKRGRSEVWNLFGQVLDTHSNVRLPYVACYACKVLYTDTGGGTGNMTRHRCPLGMSYRSANPGAFSSSSTETVEAGASSFESQHGPLALAPRMADQKPPLSVLVTQDSGSTQLVSQNSGEVSIGDVDREVLTDTLIRCCAQDMLDPSMFNGRGFRQFFDRMWSLAKRAGNNVAPQDVLPDPQMITSTLQTNLRFCTDDLKNELSRTSQGVCLTLEGLSYNGRDFKIMHGSRISHDWKWRSNVLGVFKAKENQAMTEIVNHVISTYELDRTMLRVTYSRDEFGSNIRAFVDVKEKLREILLAILTTSPVPILPMVATVDSISRALLDADVRLPFDFRPAQDDVFKFHHQLTDWVDHAGLIEGIIKTKCPPLMPAFLGIDIAALRDIVQFLDPFKETVESLLEERPNFHKVLPEWYALLHECQSVDEESSPLLRDLKGKAMELLTREKDRVITVEHRIAAILNPRLHRRMTPICTDAEKSQALEMMRVMSGIRTTRGEPISRGSSSDGGEPHRKRRMFLDALEDDNTGNDELECYLRSQFPAQQTKDIMQFWGTVGQSQFPQLSNLARRILAVPATAQRTNFDLRLANVAADQLNTFLMLRSMFETERDD